MSNQGIAATLSRRRFRWWTVDAAGLLLVLTGCAVDFLSDAAYSPLPLFVLPLMYVAWFSPRYLTGWICIALMAISNFTVAYLDTSTATYTGEYNAITRVATLILVYWIIRRLRTSALELRETKSRLEQLNREKNLLFGVISHDLRGVLGVMLATSRLLKRSAARLSQDEVQTIADRSQSAAQRSLALLEDLLEWSRLQIGGTTLESHDVAVQAIIESCLEAASASARDKRIRLEAGDIPDWITVLADERAMRVILRNLIGNALKFTGEGGVIRLSAWTCQGEAVISVKDSGIGIPEDKLRSLLCGCATSPVSGLRGEVGSGFGLSMCRDILKRFGGRLAAQSTVGKGSEFLIYLPRSGAAARQAA